MLPNTQIYGSFQNPILSQTAECSRSPEGRASYASDSEAGIGHLASRGTNSIVPDRQTTMPEAITRIYQGQRQNFRSKGSLTSLLRETGDRNEPIDRAVKRISACRTATRPCRTNTMCRGLKDLDVVPGVRGDESVQERNYFTRQTFISLHAVRSLDSCRQN